MICSYLFISIPLCCPQGVAASPAQPPSPRMELLPVYLGTPLHLAAALGLTPAVHVLLREGHVSGLRAPDSLSNAPLHAAIASGDVGVVKMVLAKTLRLRCRQELRDVLEEAAEVAVTLGDVDVVRTLMAHSGRLVNWSRVSLLRPAVISANLPLLRMLLLAPEGGEKEEKEEEKEETEKEEEVEEEVVMGGARLQQNNGGSCSKLKNNALHLAAYTYRGQAHPEEEEVAVVRCLLQHGANPNVLCFLGDRHGVSGAALHFALRVREGPDGVRLPPVAGVVRALLRAGADPNRPNALGEPPLLALPPGRCCQSLRLLLQHGADAGLTVHRDDTYLTSTTFRGSDREEHAVQFAEVVLDSGARVNAKGRKGVTALHRAIKEPRLFWYLLGRGADPEAESDGGRTVLAHLLASTSDRGCLGKVCVTLLMCAKGGVSFARSPGRSRSLILRYKETTASPTLTPTPTLTTILTPTPTPTPAPDSGVLGIQVVMLRLLHEMGYLTPNDHLGYFIKELGSRSLPDSVAHNVGELCPRPPALLSLCRRAVLVSLKRHGAVQDRAVSTLKQLPRLVRKYLQLSDLTTMVCEALGWSEELLVGYFPSPSVGVWRKE